MTNIVVNGKYYRFTNWHVGRFKRERVLKTTDVSKIIETKDQEVENYDIKLIIVEFEGKFTLVELPNLEVQCKCPKCNNTVSVQDEIAICGNCSTVTICNQYSSNSNIKSIVMATKTKHKYPIKHVLLKEIICTPITKKIETVKTCFSQVMPLLSTHLMENSPMLLLHSTLPRNNVFSNFMLISIFKHNPFSTSILFPPCQVSASIRSH